MPFRCESSSPDPLSGPSGPSIAEPPRRRSRSPSRLRFMSSPPKPHSTSKVNIHSPTKMTATSNSVLSPWRIKVVVQAEREDGGQEGTPSGRGKNRGGPPNFTLGFPGGSDGDDDNDDGAHDSVVLPPPPKPRAKRGRRSNSAVKTGRTTTVKVPVKGLSSSPEKAATADDAPPNDRGAASTNPKRPATPLPPRRRNSSKLRTSGSTAGNTPKNLAAPKPAATPKPAAASKRKRAPPKRKSLRADDDKTPAETAVSEDADQRMAEAPPAPPPTSTTTATTAAVTTTTTTTTTTKKTASTARRKSVAPPPVPTLATTRSRRSSIAPPASSVLGTPGSLSVTKRATRASSVASNVSAARSVTPRRALSGMDPNLLLSPTPSKSGSALSPSDGGDNKPFGQSSGHRSITPSKPLKRPGESAVGVSQPGSVRRQEPDSFVVSEGGSMSLPDFQASPLLPASFGNSGDISDDFSSLLEQYEDMSEEGALADVTAVDSGWEPHARHRRSGEPDCDFTYVSTGISHTPRARKKAPSPPGDPPLFHDNPVGVETFYGLDGAGDDGDHDHDGGGDLEDETMKSSPMLPERLAGPARADFTYVPDNLSYTPRKQKRGAVFSSPGSPLFKDSPIGTETFYGIPPSPSSSPAKPRDKGKGKAVEGAPLQKSPTPPKSPSRAAPSQPKDQSFCPSSPPFRVVILTPAKGLATPYRRIHDAEIPDAPASRRRTDRETPSLIRVREASEIMSDALDVDEAMTMAEQRFGEGFGGPPTPESHEHSPQPPATAATAATATAAATSNQTMEEDSVSYPSIPEIRVQSEAAVSYPSLDATGIPSPPPSQHPDRSPLTETPEPAPVPQPERAPSSSESYFARIFSPLKFRASSKSATPRTSTAETPAPSGSPSKIPGTGRSVRFAPQPSASASENRSTALEAEWAREREENIKKAQEVGAITISDTTLQTQPSPAPGGDRTEALHAEWERERSLVRRQAKEAGVISVADTTEDYGSYSVLDQDTVAFEESLARHIGTEGRSALGSSSPFLPNDEKTTVTKSKIHTSVFTATSIASSRSSPPPSLASSYAASSGNYVTTRERAHIYTTSIGGTGSESDDGTLADSLLDTLSQPAAAATSSGLVWTKEHYRHLSAIVSSRSTDPKNARTGYSVQLDRPGRLLAKEVVAALELDGEMYLALTPKECAAVERFLRREKAKGAEWDVTEVVRRTAGLRVAAVRRELTCKEG